LLKFIAPVFNTRKILNK